MATLLTTLQPYIDLTCFFIYQGMSFQINKCMLQGQEQLNFSGAATDPAIAD
jgi:hypothetical protein